MYYLIRECHIPHTRVKDMASVTVRTSICVLYYLKVILMKAIWKEGGPSLSWYTAIPAIKLSA